MSVWILMGRVQGVGSRPGEDAESNCGIVVEIAVGDVILCAEFYPGDILQLHEPARCRRFDDDISELAHVGEAAVRSHRILECILAGDGRGADLAAGTWTFWSLNAETTSSDVIP